MPACNSYCGQRYEHPSKGPDIITHEQGSGHPMLVSILHDTEVLILHSNEAADTTRQQASIFHDTDALIPHSTISRYYTAKVSILHDTDVPILHSSEATDTKRHRSLDTTRQRSSRYCTATCDDTIRHRRADTTQRREADTARQRCRYYTTHRCCYYTTTKHPMLHGKGVDTTRHRSADTTQQRSSQ